VARRNHRIVHWIAFASLSFLLTLLCRNFAQRFMGLTGLVAVGALIEWLQHIIYSGRLETSDIFDDGYGAFAGFAAAMLTLWANHKGLLSKPIRVA
jgi:hypothetical protein